MRFPHTPLALGGLALAGVIACGGWALSQVSVFSSGLFGNEAVLVQQTGPGGPGIYTTAGRLSNGRSYAYFTTFPNASFTIGASPVAQTTVNSSGVTTGGALLFNVTNGTAITITLPPTGQLTDGEVIEICNVTAAAWATNAVTVAANTNQSIVGTAANNTLTTLAASTCNKWIWGGATAANWYAFAGAGGL